MSPRHEPFVSVVTPVHNTEKHLATCIESVLSQSYSNWEYLIVNNQCTDNSLAIAEAYAARDRRIRVLHTDTLLPQLVNYNYALRNISPDSVYCKLVQADDWLFPDCLRRMIDLAERDPRIAVVSAYTLHGTRIWGKGLPCGNPPFLTESIIPGREVCRLFLLHGIATLFGSQTSVLYRADLVRTRTPFYVEASNHGDTELCFELLENSLFGFVHQILSYARIHTGSISDSFRDYNATDLRDYIIAKRYARKYLSPAEVETCVQVKRDLLYRTLACNVFRRRGDRYWEHQREGLRFVGEQLDWLSLYLMQIPRFFNLLGNPKATIERLIRRFVARVPSEPCNSTTA